MSVLIHYGMKEYYFLSALLLGLVIILVGFKVINLDLLLSFAKNSSGPVVSSLSPATGSMGTQVTVSGKRFTKTGNTIYFGVGVIPNVSSEQRGRVLKFYVPYRLVPLCDIGTPCVSQSVADGQYEIYVKNADGQSNSLVFTVTGAGGN